jgi:hypothetical protein
MATVQRLDADGHRGIARTPQKESIPGEFVGVALADSVARNDAINELMQSAQFITAQSLFVDGDASVGRLAI